MLALIIEMNNLLSNTVLGEDSKNAPMKILLLEFLKEIILKHNQLLIGPTTKKEKTTTKAPASAQTHSLELVDLLCLLIKLIR